MNNKTESNPGEQWVSMFQADQKIVPRSVWGRFAKARWLTVWLTQLVYYGTAWLQWNGRQLLLFDLEARRFFIGPLVFYPQDFIYLTGLLIVCALSLFLFTAVAGRVWCGYACPQTVYTEIFMWVERKIEGDRNQRLKRAAGPWNVDRTARAVAKWCVWAAIAGWTGFTFVGYFTPIQTLWVSLMDFSLSSWEWFWVGFYSLATYGNAGFMREQVCKYMCPYARFQSAMFDRDTLLVSYDPARGEPRGSRSRKVDPKSQGLGACIDCNLCVQVCPTGIDIRNGLQYECIGCAACVDVCDEVMDKMNYPRGLVRYGTQNGIEKGWGNRDMVKRALRPRVLIYTAVVWALIAGMATALVMRDDVRVDVIRDRTVNYRIVENGLIENVYRMMLMNSTEKELAVSVQVSSEGSLADSLQIADQAQWVLQPAESRWVVIHVRGNPDELPEGSVSFQFKIDSQAEGGTAQQIREKAVFLSPRQ